MYELELELDTVNFMDVVSHLTGLQTLWCTETIDILPSSLLTLQSLNTLGCGGCRMLSSLPSSLLNLQRWTSLQDIWLGDIIGQMDSTSWKTLCQALQTLPGLQSLPFCRIDLSCVGRSHWSFHSCITKLRLLDCGLPELPTVLIQMTSVRELVYCDSKCPVMLEGPFLKYMHVLELDLDDALAAPLMLTTAESLLLLRSRIDRPASELESVQSLRLLRRRIERPASDLESAAHTIRQELLIAAACEIQIIQPTGHVAWADLGEA